MVCRKRRDDSEMIRAARFDATWYLGRGPGRGLWFCDSGCSRELRVGHLARALKSSAKEGDLAELRGVEASRGLH